MNQRELKFRAWDNLKKQWIAKDFHIMGEVMYFQLIQQYICDNMESAEVSLDRWNDIIITQWTGLKDKDGKDIYEGDILSGQSYENPVEVVYKNNATGLQYSNMVLYFCKLDLNGILGMAVSGNIFENPELIK